MPLNRLIEIHSNDVLGHLPGDQKLAYLVERLGSSQRRDLIRCKKSIVSLILSTEWCNEEHD